MHQAMAGAVGDHLVAEMAEDLPIHALDFETGLILDDSPWVESWWIAPS